MVKSPMNKLRASDMSQPLHRLLVLYRDQTISRATYIRQNYLTDASIQEIQYAKRYQPMYDCGT